MNKLGFVFIFTLTGFTALTITFISANRISSRNAVQVPESDEQEFEFGLVSREQIKTKRAEAIEQAKLANENKYAYEVTGTLPNMK